MGAGETIALVAIVGGLIAAAPQVARRWPAASPMRTEERI